MRGWRRAIVRRSSSGDVACPAAERGGDRVARSARAAGLCHCRCRVGTLTPLEGVRHPIEFAQSQSSGQNVTGTGWIFGPSRVAPGVQRVQVTVGTGYTIDFSLPFATWLLAQHLADSDKDRDRPIGDAQAVESISVEIPIDGSSVMFALGEYDQSWWAQGRWSGWDVEVAGTRIDPSDVKLRRAG